MIRNDVNGMSFIKCKTLKDKDDNRKEDNGRKKRTHSFSMKEDLYKDDVI